MAYQTITKYTSRNFTPASQVPAAFGMPRVIEGITIHHWGSPGQDFDTVSQFLCVNQTPTSAHCVAEAGRVAWLVNAGDAAWHAGNAWANARTIGIECRPEATDADYQTVAELIRDIRAEYGNIPLFTHGANHQAGYTGFASTACPGKYDLARLDRMAGGISTQTETIKPQEWDEMATRAEIRAEINAALEEFAPRIYTDAKKAVNESTRVTRIDENIMDLRTWIAAAFRGLIAKISTPAAAQQIVADADKIAAATVAKMAEKLGGK